MGAIPCLTDPYGWGEAGVGGQKMKRPLHSMNFNDAVLRELSIERDGETVKEISVYLPNWMLTPIEILHIESGMSAAKLYTGIVNHGTAKIQHRFDDEIDVFQQVRRTILRSDDEFNKDLLHHFNPLGDKTFVKPYRRTMSIPEWCIGYLGKVSNALPIEYSASIRMATYYSLEQWKDIPNSSMAKCREETTSFESGINKYVELCNNIVA